MDTYEKKYKEALEVVKKLYQDCSNGKNDRLYHTTDLEKMFPELKVKESEDERIRKELIEYVKDQQSSFISAPDCRDKYEEEENNKYNAWIAWLEKQEGCEYIKKDWLEHIKQSWYKEGFIDGKYTPKELTINDATTLNELIDFLENGTSKLQHDLTLYANWLKTQFSPNEKQGEQKPTLRERYKNIAESEWFKKTHEGMSISDEEVSNVNKVEPKFKVGDWISNSACTIQITSIDDKYYWHDNNHVGGDIESIDKQYHLWTIEDTKEGDVLAEDPIFECPSSFVAIYKKQNEENFDSYCFVGFNGKFYEGECGHPTEYIHPATKEQRDTLMKAMADAGYEWDAEKKELRKIGQNPVDKIEPKFKVKYAVGEYNVFDTKDINGVTFYGIEDEPNHIDYVKAENCEIISVYAIKENGSPYPTKPAVFSEQKPTWSQEDREYMESLLDIINGTPSLTPSEVECHKDWLKNLKQRIGG